MVGGSKIWNTLNSALQLPIASEHPHGFQQPLSWGLLTCPCGLKKSFFNSDVFIAKLYYLLLLPLLSDNY